MENIFSSLLRGKKEKTFILKKTLYYSKLKLDINSHIAEYYRNLTFFSNIYPKYGLFFENIKIEEKTMIDDTKTGYKSRLSYSAFKERLERETDKKYLRMSELVQLMGYADNSSARAFCIRHNIPRYRCTHKQSIDDRTRECVCFWVDIHRCIESEDLKFNFVSKKHSGFLRQDFLAVADTYSEQIWSATKTSRAEQFSLHHDLLYDIETLQYRLYTTLIRAYQRERRRYRLKQKRANEAIASLPYPRRNKSGNIHFIIGCNDLERLFQMDIDEEFRHVLLLIKKYQKADFKKWKDYCKAVNDLVITEEEMPNENSNNTEFENPQEMMGMLQMLRDYPKLSPILKDIKE